MAAPGKTVEANGIITFYNGTDIRQQIEKLKALLTSSR